MRRINAGKASATLRTLVLAALVVGLAAAGPEKRSTITNVSLQEVGATTQLTFNADREITCEYVMSPDPNFIIVDVRGADNTLPREANLESAAIKGLKTDIWHTEDGTPVTRITIELAGAARNWLEPQKNGFNVMIEPTSPDQGPVLPTASSDSSKAGSGTAANTVEQPTATESAPAATETGGKTATKTTTKTATKAETTASSQPTTTKTGTATTTTASNGQTTTSKTVTAARTQAAANTQAAAKSATGAKASPDTTASWGKVTQGSASADSATAANSHAAKSSGRTSAADDSSPDVYTVDEESSSPVREMLSSRSHTFEPRSLMPTGHYASAGGRVSLDIQGADIRTVMRSLAEYSGTNIVVGKDVQGSVTVSLNRVPWVDALNTICRTQGLGWVDESGIIRVETLDNLRKEDVARSTADRQLEDLQPLTTQIVRAVYATATELKPAIERTLTSRGHVEVDPRTNSLVITDVSRRVTAAVEMVQHLDSRTPQIEITAKLVDVDARLSRELGIDWEVTGLHSDDGRTTGDIFVTPTNIIDPAGTVRFGLVRSWGTINAKLEALEQDQKADIISNPRITTVNNREARILVGRKIPLIVLDEAGNAVTQLTTIGIALRVTPHINDDDRITLDLHPEVSDLASQATVQGGIIINTSEADTRVIVDDGETAVIGGLIRSNISKLKRGVPILKDIPIVGFAFSSTSQVKEKRELLIFVTPRIVNNWAETN